MSRMEWLKDKARLWVLSLKHTGDYEETRFGNRALFLRDWLNRGSQNSVTGV
jgi:hypothetical protein